MEGNMLSTGQAAKLCAVTPNAVLKWIHEGKLTARRTAGGHHRIDRKDLEELGLMPPTHSTAHMHPARATQQRQFQYCWEHNGEGRLLDGCKECVVYQMRAQRCYEVIKLAPKVGHKQVFCKGTCEECDYYQIVRRQKTNVLLLTQNEVLATQLKENAESESFALETTDCEYACSALVETFRPDYAVIDCALGPDKSSELCKHLMSDPRIPFVRVIMAAEPHELPRDCDHQVFATIHKPLKIEGISGLIRGTWGETASKEAIAGAHK
ncbi:MAG: helix-turn-helix domain-containing protein [Pseudomonadota bacterium]